MKTLLVFMALLGIVQNQVVRPKMANTCKTIAGCSECADPKVCTVCNYQIMMVPNNQFCARYSADVNCRKLDSQYKCTACFQGFYLNSAGVCTRVEQIIAGCISQVTQVANKSTCINCGSQFRKNSEGTCVGLINNCLAYSNDLSTCTRCRDGFAYNTSTKTCAIITLIDPNCDVFTDDTKTKCSTCKTGYFLNQDICFKRIENCIQFSYSFNGFITTCEQCLQGFNLVNNTCTRTAIVIENCKAYNVNSTVCTICNAGYWLNGSECSRQNIANCALHTENKNECVACASGYYSNTTACIVQNIKNCTTYTPNLNFCTACASNFDLLNNTCVERATIANCQTVNQTSSRCLLCNNGYYLTPQQDCAAQSVSNCAQYTANTNTCSNCATGFFLFSNRCLSKIIDFCVQYDVNENCVQCALNTFLVNNQCLSRNTAQCAEYVTNSIDCSICNNGYYISNLKCDAQNVTNCTRHVANANRCAVCDLLFYNSDGQCVSQNIANCDSYKENELVCLSCAAGFYLVNNTCAAQSLPNCKTYFVNVNTCSECNPNFILNSGVCVARTIPNCVTPDANNTNCVACASGFNLVDGTCVAQEIRIENCLTQTGNNCSLCANSYYLSENKCLLQNIANCRTYQVNVNACSICSPTYFVNGTVCASQNVANCQTYNVNINTCAICNSGFYPSAGVCVAVSKANCNVYTENTNNCRTCAQTYYSSNGNCLLQSLPGCTTYVANLNVCSVCASGFNLIGGFCNAASSGPANCFEPDGILCKICADGYYVRLSRCIKQDVPFCIKFVQNKNECSECETGYRVSGVYCASIPDPNVTVANCYKQTDTSCTWCNVGYFPNEAGACVEKIWTVMIFNNKDNVPSYLSRVPNLVTFQYAFEKRESITSPDEQAWNFLKSNTDGISYSIIDANNVWALQGTNTVLSIVNYSSPPPNTRLWLLLPATTPNSYFIRNKDSGLYLQEDMTVGTTQYAITIRDAEKEFRENGYLSRRRLR